jgi:WD40 repeat protein
MPPPATSTHDALALERTPTLGPRSELGAAATEGADGGAALAGEPRQDDRYELLAEHGRGGLGRVMRARDRRLGRLVAVKELLRTSSLAQQLFVREAMITARLEHPGIVPVHEAGRWANGDPYYVMKLVSGRTLKEVMAEAHTLGERLALLPHLIAVAEAVGYAHSEQVVHRDLKPTNVLVGEFGETVVIDWGLARDLRAIDAVPLEALGPTGSPPGNGPTVTGRVIGTPQYMSPEQARGEPVGPAGDVYALGAMLYELLAGHPPVEGDSVKSLLDQVHAGPPRALAQAAPAVPQDLDAVVAKAMARAPRDRYPTARELAADLKRFQTGQLVTAQRYGRWRLVRRWIVRHRGYVAMASLAGVAIAAVAIAMLVRVFDERRVAEARRAEAELARTAAEHGEHELIAAQARAALASDPTSTLAWLKRYPIDATGAAPIRSLIDEAEAAGVARHVWPMGDRKSGLVLFSDGAHVALGEVDGRVRVYDTDRGALRVLGAAGPPVTAVAARPGTDALYVADARGALAMVDTTSGLRTPLGTVSATVDELVTARDGALLVHTADGWLRWRADGAPRPLFPAGRQNEHLTEAFDHATAAVRVGHGVDGGVRVWRGDQPAVTVAVVPGIPHALAVTADGARALVATTAAVYRVELGSGEVRHLFDLAAEVNQIAIDPNDRRAAVVGKGNDVYLIDLATGAVDVKRGHVDGVYMAAFDRKGDRLVTAGDEGTVRVWDLATGDVRELRGHKDDVLTVAISDDGHTVLSTSYDDTMRLWRLDDRRTTVVGHLDDVRMLAVMGGELVRVLSFGDRARVVDVDLAARTSTERVAAEVTSPTQAWLAPDGRTALFRQRPTQALLWRDGVVRELRSGAGIVSSKATRDGRVVIDVDESGAVTRQDERGATALAQATPGATAVPSVDGATVLVRDRVGFRVLDLATGAERAALTRAQLGLTEMARAVFIPDDPRIAITGNPDADVGMRLWDPTTGTLVSLADSRYAHPAVEVSPDGRWLSTGVESRDLRLWDTRTGAVRTTLHGHRDGVFAQAFSPDGSRLATASYDRTVRIWDLATGDSRVLSGHVGPVWAVAWMGDEDVVTASADGTVRRWAVPPQPLADATELRRRLAALTAVEIDDGHRPRSPLPRS